MLLVGSWSEEWGRFWDGSKHPNSYQCDPRTHIKGVKYIRADLIKPIEGADEALERLERHATYHGDEAEDWHPTEDAKTIRKALERAGGK